MKITRKEFIEVMTSNESYFVGRGRNAVYGAEELYRELHTMLDPDNLASLDWRTAKKHSNYIRFSTGSRLDFNKYQEYGRYDYDRYSVYHVSEYRQQNEYCPYTEEQMAKPWVVMYYVVTK